MAVLSVFDYEPEEQGAVLPRSGQHGESSNVLQLSVSSLKHDIDWRAASQCIRCLPGRVVVEMLPAVSHIGGIGLPDRIGANCRPDVGVVLSSVDGPPAGTVVAVRPYDGTWIEGADCGAYEPHGQIRVYGAFKEYDRPEWSNWWDSVVCGVTLEDGRVRLSHPYVDKIVMKLDPLEETDGGVMLSDLDQFRNGLATIVAVGSDVPDLKPGDRVSYDVNMLLQTGLGLDLTDDRDYSICTAHAINYVIG